MERINRMTQAIVSIVAGLFIVFYLVYASGMDKAVKNLLLGDDVDREAARVHYQYALSLLAGHKQNLALKEFSEAIEADPSFTDAYFERGKLLMLLAAVTPDQSARRDFDKVIELAPDNPKYADAYNFRGALNYEAGRWQEFIDDTLKFLELDKSLDEMTKANNYAAIGEAYLKLDDLEGALASFTRALELYPGSKSRIQYSLPDLVQRRITLPAGETKAKLEKLIEYLKQWPESQKPEAGNQKSGDSGFWSERSERFWFLASGSDERGNKHEDFNQS